MKKQLITLLAACGCMLSVYGQQTDTTKKARSYHTDVMLPHWALDVNLLGGGLTEKYATANTADNYPGGVNLFTGNLKFIKGSSYGFDAELDYFFGKSNHWGVGIGFAYLSQMGTAKLDSFHAEYEAYDGNGNIYRQLVSSNGSVQEQLKITNINIPVLLKYKDRFSKHWGFMADLGAMINLQEKNSYTTNGAFDYEAIYQYNAEGGTTYDGAATPNASQDVFITKNSYYNTPGLANTYSTVGTFFAAEQKQGFNVGLGVKPNSNNGSVSFTSGSIGLFFRPAINYYFSDQVALTVGVYYLYQPFKSKAESGYELTNGIGNYNSVLNSVTEAPAQSFGGNLGVRIYLDHSTPLQINGIDNTAPVICGNCDGTMTLHGLKPNKNVTISYDIDSANHGLFIGKTDDKGDVTLGNLCAGSYTNITAKQGHKSAKGYPVSIVNPVMTISNVTGENPTANGKCDGTITLSGLYAGKGVTVNYSLNGTMQPAYNSTVNSDNTVKLNNLCAGNYSNIVVTIGNCTASGQDASLTAPAPPPPPPVPALVPQADITKPILFQLNKTVIHEISIPTLEDAAKLAQADPNAIIEVDGYTDNTGKASYNRKLSVKRAKVVKKKLEDMGVDGKHIKIKGHGSKDPVATNKTREGRHQNRRAVMHLQVSGN